MLSLNVTCAVCKVPFLKNTTIHSTNCGHVFHADCMVQWKLKSLTCPQCRSSNVHSHPIYLNFDDTHEYQNVVHDIEAKLKSSKEEIKKLKEDKDKKEKKIDDIKRLYNISEQWRAELQDKLKIQSNDHSKEIESLKMLIETLEKDKGVQKSLCEKINEFNTENLKLKKNFNESETTVLLLKQKLEMQENRLKYVTTELEKQFVESVKQDLNAVSKENVKAEVKQSQQNRFISKKLPQAENTAKKPDARHMPNKTQKRKLFKLAQPNDTKVYIKDFPRNNLVYPLEDTVILLASKMSISLTSADILKVNIVNPDNLYRVSSTIKLLVEFKEIDVKIQFLTYRNRLKFHTSTKLVQLKEYIDERIYPIFMYANRNLRTNGFEFIGCKENKVIVKKKLHDAEEIVIKTKEDVDALLNRSGILKPSCRSNLGSISSLYDLDFFI